MLHDKIFFMADSHARNLKGFDHIEVATHDSRSMYWVTTAEFDKELANFNKDKFWLFGFGEVDVRHLIYNQIVRKKREEDEVIITLVNGYVSKLTNNHSKVGFVSVMPPAHLYRGTERIIPHDICSDQERLRYTQKINLLLRSKCIEKGLIYVDLYNEIKDSDGFLPFEISDGSVHLNDFSMIPGLLRKYDLY